MEYNYGFLFKKSSLPKADLSSMLLLDEFTAEADIIMSKGKGITDEDIYNIVKKLYFPKLKAGERSGIARRLNKAIRHFSLVLFGNEAAWEKEFEEY